MSTDKIEIRDLRDSSWLWVEKEILFSEHISATEYKVYSGLASFAGNANQKSWPSVTTLSKKLHMSRTTIIKAVKKLNDLKLISIDRDEGYSNRYYLLKVDKINAPTKKKKEIPEPDFINPIIDLFQHVNPSWRILFRNKSQRNAVKRMVEAHGRDEVTEMVKLLPVVITRKFAPRVTTPVELENKMGQLVAFIQQEKVNVKGKQIIT